MVLVVSTPKRCAPNKRSDQSVLAGGKRRMLKKDGQHVPGILRQGSMSSTKLPRMHARHLQDCKVSGHDMLT